MSSTLDIKTSAYRSRPVPHTPGLWRLADDFEQTGLIESDFGNVATVAGFANPDDETYPNANLIAAAPRMIEVLYGLLGILAISERDGGRVTIHAYQDAIEETRKVIAEARGEAVS